ncbi:hypothetical protein CTAYLR_002332 [Chrysophaeum taylorii]|uniref:Protein HGH1 homolog n=1 Tax=Chrysophaeum taylorii TaxID=2483200 RepID=A0AAD7UH16_9STRA|nr:hypothetical protein CTAYLR_002332 [Chrysophaeum taylorii]
MDELLGLVRENLSNPAFCGEAGRALAAASGEPQHIATLVDTPDGIELLGKLSNVPTSRRDALVTLVNVTAWASAQGERRLAAVVGRLDLSLTSAATADEEAREAALKLLQNATTTLSGCAACEGVVVPLLRAFAQRPPDHHDTWALFGETLRNLTAHSETTRRLLLRRSSRVLEALLPQLLVPRRERRRGVAAALKHCAIDRDAHYFLDTELGAPAYVARALADDADLAKLSPEDRAPLAAAFEGLDGGRDDQDPDLALLLLESLHCFCATRRCRRRLRALNAYFVVRDADIAFASSSKDKPQDARGVLVTADNTNADDDDDDGVLSRISRVCSEIADMLLRRDDDGGDIASLADAVVEPPARKKSTAFLKKSGFLNNNSDATPASYDEPD